MPYSITIHLQTLRTLPQEGGVVHRALNALFYRWLETAEPRLARFVHEQADPKPFTLSPLAVDGDERCHFRLTLLEDEYWAYVATWMKREQTVRIGPKILALSDEVQVEHRAYGEIAELAATEREIALRFESPTSFRTREMYDALPDPRRVFQSHLVRWNAFAEPLEPQDVYLEWVASYVAVSQFDLKTEVLDFGSHVEIGCVGEVHFRVAERVGGDREMVRWLNRLADYAYFCGTGHKTTQGMGQTRRLPVPTHRLVKSENERCCPSESATEGERTRAEAVLVSTT